MVFLSAPIFARLFAFVELFAVGQPLFLFEHGGALQHDAVLGCDDRPV